MPGTPGSFSDTASTIGDTHSTVSRHEKCSAPDTPDTHLALDDFLNKYTSEDNASFEDIIEKTNERVVARYKSFYDKVGQQEKILAITESNTIRKAIENAEGKYLTLETWRYTPKNPLFYGVEGAPLTPQEEINLALSKKEIKHANTRFLHEPYSASLSCNRTSVTPTYSSLPSTLNTPESPRVNGYGFVVTPSPAPGVDLDPLMTWGTIEGTPFRLDAGDVSESSQSGPLFAIPEEGPRTQLGMCWGGGEERGGEERNVLVHK